MSFQKKFPIPLIVFIISCSLFCTDPSNKIDFTALLPFIKTGNTNFAPFSYSQSEYSFFIDESITMVTPSSTETILACSSIPNLPSGLNLDQNSCSISGIPTSLQVSTDYTITATTASGEYVDQIKIKIAPIMISNFKFPDKYFGFTNNKTITPITPSITGTIQNCSANLALPTGLNINSNTCVLTGNPTVSQLKTKYTITASNSDGSKEEEIFISVGNIYINEAFIKSSNNNAEDSFGNSIAIYGDTMVIGAPGEDSNQSTITNGTTASSDNSNSFSGAAYVFVRNGNTWTQQAYLKPPNPGAGYNFGNSVAIYDNTIVVGASMESSGQTSITNGTNIIPDNSQYRAGAAYVFVRNGNTWSHQAYLKAPNARSLSYFGISTSIYENTIVVGSYGEKSEQTTITNGTTASLDVGPYERGAAYVFVRKNNIWTQQAYLKPSNGASFFGYSTSIHKDTIVVGAPQEGSSQTTITNGSVVATDYSAASSGAAYVFVRNNNIWSQQSYLKAPNNKTAIQFGNSVSNYENTIVVGAPFMDSGLATITNGSVIPDNEPTMGNSGGAYVFVRAGNIWSHQAFLKPAKPNLDDWFGIKVSIHGDTIAVGASYENSIYRTIINDATGAYPPLDDGGSDAGAAYIFTRSGNIWSYQSYLKAPNADSNDHFSPLSVYGDTVVVGGPGESSTQSTISNGSNLSGVGSSNSYTNAGAAYVFRKQ